MSMLKKMLLFIVGIIAIMGFISIFGLEIVIATVVSSRLDLIALALLIEVGILIFLSIRLLLVTKTYERIGFWYAFKVTMSGLLVNFLTPIAKIGGEPVKILMLKKRFSATKATAIITLDTFVEVFSSVGTVILVLIFFFYTIPAVLLPIFAIFLVVVVVLLSVSLKISLTPKWIEKIINWGIRRVSKYRKFEQKDYASLFSINFQRMLNNKPVMVQTLAVSFGMKILEFARMWLVFAAIGQLLPVHVILIAWSVILVLFMVPWLPGGLGLIELGGATVFILFGIAPSIAASGMVIERFISFWFLIFLGFLVVSQSHDLLKKSEGNVV